VRPKSWLWRHRKPLFLLTLVATGGLAAAAYAVLAIPLPPAHVEAQTSMLFDANNHLLASLSGTENRVNQPLSAVPKVVRDAVVATEDHGYYHHGGVDPIGLVRAAVTDVRSGRGAQGGSTITQQYVKNVYTGNRRTLLRKLREAALAIKLERTYSKDEILERYLNTIYFGRGAYGVGAASQAYFGRPVSALGLPEAAYLAGLIRAPVVADYSNAPAAATRRRNLSLQSMERYRFITPAARAGAEAVPLATYVIAPVAQSDAALAPGEPAGSEYFVQYVRAQLVRRFGETAVSAGGLRVRTTLDPALQQHAYDAVYGPGGLRPGEPAGALVATDDGGHIRAMVGGRDYQVSKVNLALGQAGGGSGRQAGSTFKPFLLAEAVNEGYTVQSQFDAPDKLVIPKADNGKDYTVGNFGGESFPGQINLIDATKSSVNTVYAQLQYLIGPRHLVDMAHALGVQSTLEPNVSLVLGTSDVSVLEMASAYSTLANQGLSYFSQSSAYDLDPHSILEVGTADGVALDKPRITPVRVLDARKAAVVTYCLQQVVSSGTGQGARIGRPLAGKTGTTEDFGDAWFIGYTPRLTAALWMGYPQGSDHKMTDVRGIPVQGGGIPAELFRRFMAAALKDEPAYGTGQFPVVTSFPGRSLSSSQLPFTVSPATTTTTSTTTTTLPGGTTTTSTSVKPGATTTTASAATTTTTAKPG